MPGVFINWWTLLVAFLINMAVWAVWHSPVVFGKNQVKPDNYKLAAIAAVIQIWVLVHFIRYAGALTVVKGAEIAFWLWLAFTAAAMSMSTNINKRPHKLLAIKTGYFLVTMLINGALLAAWR